MQHLMPRSFVAARLALFPACALLALCPVRGVAAQTATPTAGAPPVSSATLEETMQFLGSFLTRFEITPEHKAGDRNLVPRKPRSTEDGTYSRYAIHSGAASGCSLVLRAVQAHTSREQIEIVLDLTQVGSQLPAAAVTKPDRITVTSAGQPFPIRSRTLARQSPGSEGFWISHREVGEGDWRVLRARHAVELQGTPEDLGRLKQAVAHAVYLCAGKVTPL
ncbi:MAG TPA: hypothetical protein VEZ47_12800 [Gemmatirosa sp.]|nr:hypothetical protein [Gemmatirosa sp.]